MRIFLETEPPVNKAAAWAALPPEILQRPEAAGIRSVDDWRAVSSRRRRAIFGIVPSMVKVIDGAAAEREP